MQVTKILQDGNIFAAEVLDISADDILAKFKKAIGVQTNLALGAGVPTASSAPHSLLNGFKNLIAACASSGATFPEAQAFLDAAASAPAAGGAPAAAAAAEEKPAEKEKTEEEDVDMGGLFGDDDDGY